ncbi:MAG: DNA repair protein RadC [Campylobacterales bacterium]|nr:DNA repair protein RadC [Campylobacterales bacterium]
MSKNIPIKEVPFALRPREKFKKYGVTFLDNFELLAILLGSGVEGKNVFEVSKSILKKYTDKLVDADYKELMKEKGIGEVKAIQLACAFELSKRFLNKDLTKSYIESPSDLESYLKFLKSEKKEHLVAFYLSPTNHLLAQETISIGTVDSNLIHPREIFAPALEHRATGVILAHNHPFGNSNPSNEDIEITKKIAEAGEVLGVKLIDHVIVSANDNFSFLSSHYKVKNDEQLYLRQGMVQKSLFDIYEINNRHQNKDDITFIDLFCGIGGFHTAMQEASSKINIKAHCVFSSDIDAHARKSYYHNYGILPVGDITKVKEEEVPQHDFLFAGFPCQAFSVAGYRKGFEDTRGTLFFDIARIVAYHKPKVLLLENVKGLVNHDSGKTFTKILNILESDLKYFVQYKILNTSEYANIPHNRERIYIIASKQKLPNIFPKKQKLNVGIRDLLLFEKQDDKFYYNKHKYYDKLSLEINKMDTVYQWRRHYVRENKNKLCPTLTANMGTGGHNVPLIKDNFGIRKLTPAECLNFQGFPKTFSFPDIPQSQKYKQVGNSISVPVVTQIIYNILVELENV